MLDLQTLTLFLVFCLCHQVYASPTPVSELNNINHHNSTHKITRHEVLKEGQYHLEWTANVLDRYINFTITATTKGYVSLGFSYTGDMVGSDIFIGGVRPDGEIYGEDRYATGRIQPILDDKQDWDLYLATENATHTVITIGRKLDTCDKQDIPINDDTVKIIWGFGETDDITYHGHNRGVHAVNILDPAIDAPDLSQYKVWVAAQDLELSSNDTIYWCTFYKAPQLAEKHHIVGFNVHAKDNISLRHAHHVDVLKCVPPKGENADDFFGKYLGNGYECYHSQVPIPTSNCEMFEFQWSIGGGMTMFPNDIGVPFGGSEQTSVYYMVEVHHDNPNREEGLKVKTGMEFYYTDKLRAIDAGFMFIGSLTTKKYSLTIPPASDNFVQAHHCASKCTNNLPKEGINAFVYLLHSHLAGRMQRLRRFRGEEELPWFANDENYDFNYQNNRMLRQEIKIMPGDHLTLECHYNTTWKVHNPKRVKHVYTQTTISGRSPREEMCQVFIMYYPRVEKVNMCGSYFPQQEMLDYFGIQNVTNNKWEIDPIVLSPEHFAGEKYTKVIDEVAWDNKRRVEFQELVRYGDHQGYCDPFFSEAEMGPVNYPKVVKEYSRNNDFCVQVQEEVILEWYSGKKLVVIVAICVCVFAIICAIILLVRSKRSAANKKIHINLKKDLPKSKEIK